MSKNISAVVPDDTYYAYELLAKELGQTKSKTISMILTESAPGILKLAQSIKQANELKHGSIDALKASLRMIHHETEQDLRQLEIEVDRA